MAGSRLCWGAPPSFLNEEDEEEEVEEEEEEEAGEAGDSGTGRGGGGGGGGGGRGRGGGNSSSSSKSVAQLAAVFGVDDDRIEEADLGRVRCKICDGLFVTRKDVLRHLRKQCTPAEAVYFPGATLNPDAAKHITRKQKKKELVWWPKPV